MKLSGSSCAVLTSELVMREAALPRHSAKSRRVDHLDDRDRAGEQLVDELDLLGGGALLGANWRAC